MRRAACLTLAILLGLPAAEPAPPATDTAPPPPPAVEPGGSDLRARLPASPQVVDRDGQLWWQGADPAQAVPFTGVDGRQQPLVEAAGLTIAVQRRLIADSRTDALAALLRLAPLAKEAGLEGLRLGEGPLTGVHLRNDTAVVVPDAVLRLEPAAGGERDGEVAELKAASEALVARLPGTDMPEPARRALGALLAKLTATTHDGKIDDATPEFCRRVIRSGLLRSFFPDLPEDDRVEAAVQRAETMLPIRRWTGAGGELTELRDAFGRTGWAMRTPLRSAWLTTHPRPIYFDFRGMPELTTVVELAPGADPRADGAEPVAARLWRQAGGDWQPVVEWSAAAGLAGMARWAEAVPRRTGSQAVQDWLPPHILVTSLHGDVLALATAHGTLRPPRDGSAGEGERFLAEAARLLPDAAHLDLIGQHLLRYVYDSPDPRRPNLIGNRQDKGDIHQTALQTLALTAGGMLRGDCDDLAELYETIAERQGRTAHVIGVPGHAACAWAERRGDAWHVLVLQTGPAMEFADADPKAGLQNALMQAYQHFDDSEQVDPNGLGLLLRFTDENQRGSWRLGYRIFSDPEYARIMIDVQKDWHYSTYQRGIDKMRRLIASSEQEANDTANHRELSGLYSFTGQYALACESHRKAIDLVADDARSSLFMLVEQVGHLFDAGRAGEARETALDLLSVRIPALEAKLGPALMQVSVQLAGTLASHDARDLALRALRPGLAQFDARLADLLGRRQGQGRNIVAGQQPVAGLNALGDWLEGPEYDANLWDNHPALQQYRRLAQMLSGTAIACLEGVKQEELAKEPELQVAARFAQVWLDRIAFHDIDDAGEALYRYASAGHAYATLLGEERFQALLEAAPRPGADTPPRRRVGGIAQVVLDAGWIRRSPPYWSGRLLDMFSRDKDAFDRAAALRLAAAAIEAAEAVKGTPLDHPRIALQTHLVRLVQALLEQDEAALRALLRTAKDSGDKDWVDDTAQWLGTAARWLDPAWYGTVLRAWHEEIDYKPKYFWIAWRAALNKAPQHALMAAEAAARIYPNDQAFADELRLMRQVLAK